MIRWADAVLLFALVVIHNCYTLGARGDMQCWLLIPCMWKEGIKI
jgi:hypothetical protein